MALLGGGLALLPNSSILHATFDATIDSLSIQSASVAQNITSFLRQLASSTFTQSSDLAAQASTINSSNLTIPWSVMTLFEFTQGDLSDSLNHLHMKFLDNVDKPDTKIIIFLLLFVPSLLYVSWKYAKALRITKDIPLLKEQNDLYRYRDGVKDLIQNHDPKYHDDDRQYIGCYLADPTKVACFEKLKWLQWIGFIIQFLLFCSVITKILTEYVLKSMVATSISIAFAICFVFGIPIFNNPFRTVEPRGWRMGMLARLDAMRDIGQNLEQKARRNKMQACIEGIMLRPGESREDDRLRRKNKIKPVLEKVRFY